MDYIGDFNVGATSIPIYFTTHAQTGASIAPLTAFETADIKLYKNGVATPRSSQAGWTITSPHNSITGLHCIVFDTSDNTDAGFYSAGSTYTAVLSPDTETVDGLVVVKVLGSFSLERVNRVSAVTGSVGSVVGNVGGNVVGSVGSVTGNVGGNVVGTVGGVAGVTFPTNFADLAITSGTGRITVGSMVANSITESVFNSAAGSFPSLGVIDQGTAQLATSTTLQIRAAATFADNELNGAWVTITGGTTGVGQTRRIRSNVGSTDTLNVDAWATTPTGTITYKIRNAPAILDVNVKNINDVSTSGVTTIGDHIGTVGADAAQSGDSFAIVNNGTYGNSALNTAIGTRMPTSLYTAPPSAATILTTFLSTTNGAATIATQWANSDVTNSSRLAASGYTAPPTVAQIVTGVWTDTAGGDFGTVGSIGKSLADSSGLVLTNLTHSIPTAAENATATWRDTTAGDFTVAASIGKALFVNAVPGAAGGHFIAGANAGITVNITGNVSGSVGSVTGLNTANLDATVSSRLAASSYAAPPSSAANAAAVRTELTTELSFIDVNISTRLAEGDYVVPPTPPTAAAIASAVRTNLAAELGRIDVASSTRMATFSYTAPPTVSQIATGVWQDATAGDFTVASSIGKSLYVNAVPGAANGHFIAGLNAGTTVDITGSLSGNVGGIAGIGFPANFADMAITSGTGRMSVGSMAANTITEATFNSAAGSFNSLGVVDQGTAQAVTSTTLQIRAAATFADNELNGAWVTITGGATGVGQTRRIKSNVGSTDTLTVDAWATTPTGTVTYKIRNAPQKLDANVQSINDVSTSGVTTIGDHVGTVGAPPSTASIAAAVAAQTDVATMIATVGTNLDARISGILTGVTVTVDDTSLAAFGSAVRSELTPELARIDVPVSTVGGGASPTTIAFAVRTELAAELARIDVGVGTRLASAAYVPADPSEIAAYVRTNLATELSRIDVSTSSRLASASYAAAPTAAVSASAVRAELAAELARIDVGISTRPTAAVNASTMLSAVNGSASVAAQLSRLDVLVSAGGASPATVASAVRTNLATELARIDVSVGSRMGTFVYTAPPTAVQNSDAVRTNLAAELARIDTPTSSRLAASSYAAPPSSAANAAALLASTNGSASVAAQLARVDIPVSTAGGGASPGTVAAAVRTELATELARIDVGIGTRPTAVANAAALLAATNGSASVGTQLAHLDLDISGVSGGSGGGASPAAIATAVAQQTSIAAALATISTNLDARVSQVGSGDPVVIAAAVRTNLATELSRIDVGIGSRLATSNYTIPPTAAVNAAAVRSNLATELARLDSNVSSAGNPSAIAAAVAAQTSIAGLIANANEINGKLNSRFDTFFSANTFDKTVDDVSVPKALAITIDD